MTNKISEKLFSEFLEILTLFKFCQIQNFLFKETSSKVIGPSWKTALTQTQHVGSQNRVRTMEAKRQTATRGEELNKECKKGETPLHKVCNKGNVKAVVTMDDPNAKS